MVCPRCGSPTAERGRCSRCGIPLEQTTLATGVLAVDTTGLPDGATFVPTTAPGTASSTMSGAATLNNSRIRLGTAVVDVADGSRSERGPLTIGAFGPRYHVIKLLGAGGMGAVYQAWDAELSVAVALKVIRGDRRRISPEVEKRFKHELLLARQVTHKHVVRIHDLGEINGIKYITMPYVQGADLASVLRRDGKLTVPNALRFARQIASGLQAAHEAGVVHRDLKPANIMIGADENAQIMDFGISASADEVAGGGVVGTLEYMAPEQGAGKVVDARADIYAFGLIIYEMLIGPRQVASATPQARIEVMKQRFANGLPPVNSVDATIPEPLSAVATRCLEREPAARFQTTTELIAALDALDEAGELIPIPARVSKRSLSVAAALVLALLGGTYFVGKRSAPLVPKQHPPVSVLIADFDNRARDPAFDGSLEQALALAVEGASFVTTYRRDEARKVAAQLRPGSTLDENVAQLVALREGIGVLLTGSVELRGAGYFLTVRAIDPANSKVLTTATAMSDGKADLLQALGAAASKIRTVLGDTTPESAKLAAIETVTTASLSALADYSRAQDLLYNSKDEEAIAYYKRAIAQDSKFGRAYSGWAISAENLGRHEEAAEAWKRALALVDRMTDREKYRTLGTYYIRMAHNYDKAIENFSTLVKLYPNDRAGHLNLALAYFYTRNFAKALEEGRRSVEGAPRDVMNRTNYALYAMYAGDFATAAAEANAVIKQDPEFYRAYLPIAMAALVRLDFEAARNAYEAMAKSGAPGASVANLGLADMALYQGRFREAEALLRAGIVVDERQQNSVGLAAKYTALSEAYLGSGKKALAVASAEGVLKMLGRDVAAVPAARVLITAGKPENARALAAQLGEQLEPELRAYGKILDGLLTLQEGRKVAASESLLAAQKLVDLWWARLDLGIGYVQADHYAEALGELTQAEKRHGETTAILLDDLPSIRYLAPVPYWTARAQEALGQGAAAAGNYKKYLAIRPSAPGDRFATDARRRLSSRRLSVNDR